MFNMFFFFKQKTAYEMRISDWSSDVCSSDLCSSVESCSGGNHGYRKRCGLDHADVGRLACTVPRVRGYIICIAPNHPHCAVHFVAHGQEIGRASCREKVWSVRVDRGGRRNIKQKTNTKEYEQ